MRSTANALRAYATAASRRDPREQEAELFRTINERLRRVVQQGGAERIRALADTRRLWLLINGVLQDPANTLPQATRAGILALGHRVQQCLDSATPDIEFLIAVNESVASGLSPARAE